MQVQEQLAGTVPLVAVGFSPPDALGCLADHLNLVGRVLSDRDRGGDALVVDGVVRRVWRPGSPDDRVEPAVLAAVARSV